MLQVLYYKHSLNASYSGYNLHITKIISGDIVYDLGAMIRSLRKERKITQKQLGDLLMQFLRSEGLETPLLEHRIVNAWPAVMGEAVSKYTSELYIKNSVLWVKLKSPALKQNLLMMHGEITRKLNAYVQSQVITDVHFL